MEWLIVIAISAYAGYKYAKREEKTSGGEYYETKKLKDKDLV